MATAREKAKVKADKAPSTTYARRRDSLRLEDQKFTFRVVRPGLGNVDITDLVEQIEWRDESEDATFNVNPVLRGSVTFRQPHPNDVGPRPDIRDGHRVRCTLLYDRREIPLWEMRLYTKREQVADGTLQYDMADDLVYANTSVGNFKYVRGKKKKKNGWRYDEIVRDICRTYRIPLGPLTKGTKRIKSFVHKDLSPLTAIRLAVEEEFEATGKRLVIRWGVTKRGGFGMTVLPLRRNQVLYDLADQVTDAEIATTRRAGEDFATVLMATGAGKVGKKGRQKSYTSRVVSKEGVKQYGYIARKVKIDGNIDSQGELDERARKLLEKNLRPALKVELDHYGIAFVRRGDAVRVSLPEVGLRQPGAKEQKRRKRAGDVADPGLMFVQSVTHTLSAGEYAMHLVFTYTDPLDPAAIQRDLDAAAREGKARPRASGASGGSGPSGGKGSLGYPLAVHGTSLGGVAAHNARAFGNWQSDNAVDIGVPQGTAVYAVDDGTITKLGGSWDGTGKSNPNGFNVTLETSGNAWFYTHLRYRAPGLKVGDRVSKGAFFGSSGAANGVNHLHIGSRQGDPSSLLGV